MIKMKDKTDTKMKKSSISNDKKNVNNQSNRKKEKDKTVILKNKECTQNKKAGSTNKILSQNRKINININQNININSNIYETGQNQDNKEKSSKPKTDNPKNKANNKLNAFLSSYESDKLCKNNLILSAQLSKKKFMM